MLGRQMLTFSASREIYPRSLGAMDIHGYMLNINARDDGRMPWMDISYKRDSEL